MFCLLNTFHIQRAFVEEAAELSLWEEAVSLASEVLLQQQIIRGTLASLMSPGSADAHC